MNPSPVNSASLLESIDESARREFEASWATGSPRLIEDFIPRPDDPRRLATLEELVSIELELAWKAFQKSRAGPQPSRVENYLSRFPELNSFNIVSRLLRQEFDIRKNYGDRPSTNEFRERFPEFATVVDKLETDATNDNVQGEDKPPVVDGYEVLRVLGKGGMGVVYEAVEGRLERLVALKTSRLGSGKNNSEIRMRFLAEARVAARLEHPGVVPVHELVTPSSGEPFYTMKLVRGKSLADAIYEFHASKRPPSEQAVARRRLIEAFLAVTRTMAFAHEKGVIHRDLKPANIVLGEYGETLILDWGLAKELSEVGPDDSHYSEAKISSVELTARGVVLGTPAYMSPEQAAGRTDEVDAQSDVYALGAILYHILTGQLPHRCVDGNILQFILESEPVRPSIAAANVARPLEEICLKAMTKRREDRYPTAKALADDVERCLAGEPVSVYRERLHERFARWSRRNRLLVATGSVAVVLSTLGIVVGLYLHWQAEQERREQELNFQIDRNRLAYESERKETQARTEKREAILRSAQYELARGIAELKSDRFSAAEQAFRKGLVDINSIEDPGMRSQLERLHREAGHLAGFYRYWERAERLALVTDDISYQPGDDTVVAACEAGLKNLGVLNGPAEWWNHLPDSELQENQRHRLREETCSSLGLLAMWRTKRAVMKELTGAKEASKIDYRNTIEILGRIQAFVRSDTRRKSGERVSPAADGLELFCRLQLGEPPNALKLPLVGDNATDLYFLGVTHVFLEFSRGYLESGQTFSKILPLLGRGSMVDILMSRLGDFKKLSGLDFTTPLVTAERQLRNAVAMDPSHYLSHYWLGRCLREAKNFSAAEQAFNSCIALRPDYVPAYIGRAETLIIESNDTKRAKPPRLAQDLLEGALRGIEKAPESVRADPQVRWFESICLERLGREDESLQVATDAMEKEIVQRNGVTSGLPSIAKWALKYMEEEAKLNPNNLEIQACHGVALLGSKHFKAARDVVDKVLMKDQRQSRALVVRGMLRLESGEAQGALQDFDAVLNLSPRQQAALAGRAWTLEQLGDWEAALKAHSAQLPEGFVGKGPQHLQPYLGQARAYQKLGRSEDARKALEAAQEIDPVAAENLSTKLFPPTSP